MVSALVATAAGIFLVITILTAWAVRAYMSDGGSQSSTAERARQSKGAREHEK